MGGSQFNWRTMGQVHPSCLGWHLPLVDRILGKYMVCYSLVAKWVVWRVVWEREVVALSVAEKNKSWQSKGVEYIDRTRTKIIGKHDSIWLILTCLRRFLLIVLYCIRTGLCDSFPLDIRLHFGIGSSYSRVHLPTCPICYD